MTYGAVIGVDPGVRGGIVALDPAGYVIFHSMFRPEQTESALVEVVLGALEAADGFVPTIGATVYIEKVGVMPRDGRAGAFTFGAVYGLLRGTVLASGYRPVYVYPGVWQAAMGCLSGGNKNVTKRRAQALFPTMKITHGIADALLIAEYGRRRGLEGSVLVDL